MASHRWLMSQLYQAARISSNFRATLEGPRSLCEAPGSTARVSHGRRNHTFHSQGVRALEMTPR